MGSARDVSRAAGSLPPDPQLRALDALIDLCADSFKPGLEPRVFPNPVVDARGDHPKGLTFWRNRVRPLEPRERLLGVSRPCVVFGQPPRGEDRAVVPDRARRE